MSGLHLIMPMGGKGYRFFKDGFSMPKPLIQLNGKPFFYWAVQSVSRFVKLADISFVVLQEHIDEFNIDNVIREYYPEARIVVIPQVLPGAVLTCMEGVKELSDDGPILFNDCDHMFLSRSFYDFCAAGEFSAPDAALLTFKSTEPKFSFIRMDESGRIIGTVEKQAVSDLAICGAYYFRNADIFLNAAEQYLHECSYEEFFVSGVYNVLAKEGRKLRSFDTDVHISFGTPEEYFAAEKDARLKEVE